MTNSPRVLLLLLALTAIASCGPNGPTSHLGESTSADIAPNGGSVELTQVARVTFPSGSFSVPQTVTVATTNTPEGAMLWDNSTAIFETGDRSEYEIRISVGAAPLLADSVTIDVTIPTALGTSLNVGLFAEAVEGNDIESINRFAPVAAAPTGDQNFTLTLPNRYFFKNLESADQYQAVLVITSIGSKQLATAVNSLKTTNGTTQAVGGCPDGILKLSPPLKNLVKHRDFDLQLATIINGVTKGMHPGTDYVAADSTELLAAGDGKVTRVVDSNGKPQNGDNDGAGGTVVIAIPGSGSVQYMHLKKGEIKVKVGDQVKAGQVIGLSDTSGFVTGAHLHFEFRPATDPSIRIDPELCMDYGKALVYEGVFDFSQERTFASTRTFEASAGTLRFEFDSETPAIPSFNIKAMRHYVLKVETGVVTDYVRDASTCAVSSSQPNITQGELVIFPDTNEYSINVDLNFSASGTCPDSSNTPVSYSAAVFTEMGSDFAADCATRGPGSLIQTSGFIVYPVTDANVLKNVYDLSCDESGATNHAIGHWTLNKVQ